MTLPTRWTFSSVDPLAAQVLDAADGSVQKSRSLIESVSTRLISSGMPRSKLRSPASTCTSFDTELHGHEAAGDRAVDVAHHQHRVGLVLQHHRLEGPDDLGGLDGVADPLPTPRLISGSGIPSCRKNRSLMLGRSAGPCAPAAARSFVRGGVGVHQRRDLHQIGPRTHDVDDLHALASESCAAIGEHAQVARPRALRSRTRGDALQAPPRPARAASARSAARASHGLHQLDLVLGLDAEPRLRLSDQIRREALRRPARSASPSPRPRRSWTVAPSLNSSCPRQVHEAGVGGSQELGHARLVLAAGEDHR